MTIGPPGTRLQRPQGPQRLGIVHLPRRDVLKPAQQSGDARPQRGIPDLVELRAEAFGKCCRAAPGRIELADLRED